jgi:hypothetical protein
LPPAATSSATEPAVFELDVEFDELDELDEFDELVELEELVEPVFPLAATSSATEPATPASPKTSLVYWLISSATGLPFTNLTL